MKKVTTFAPKETAVGMQISFAYAEVDDITGKIIQQNARGNIVVQDEQTLEHIDAVFEFLQNIIAEY